jgi:hypothetical protein
MLAMSFVYFNIWQIKLIRPEHFGTAMVGFSKDIEKNLLEASSPFVFSTVNERTVLRFLKLIQCDNGKIGTYAKLVDERNDTAHANGNIFFNSEDELARKVRDVLRVVKEIQSHSEGIILDGYKSFLRSSVDPEEREHVEDEDQVREVFVGQHYMSTADVAFCRAFNLDDLVVEPGFEAMQALHATLVALYPIDEESEAA